MPFGQLILGPPGSGKTTYCAGLQQFFALTGRRCAVVNLDPANDELPYDCSVDIRDLVSLDSVQHEFQLGPNGAMVYCMEYLEANLDWLQEQLQRFESENYYFLFDSPGQVELFSIHRSIQNILHTMTNDWHYRLCAVQLVDAHLCSNISKYMAGLLVCLSTTLHLELPQIYALSKFDLAEQYGELDFAPDFYLRAQGLDKLADAAETELPERFAKLTRGLCEVIEDFGLVGFVPLAIEDRESVLHIVSMADKANGFAFAGHAKAAARCTAAGAGQGIGEMPLRDHDDLPEEFRYGSGIVLSDPEDLWERMREKHTIGIKERLSMGEASTDAPAAKE